MTSKIWLAPLVRDWARAVEPESESAIVAKVAPAARTSRLDIFMSFLPSTFECCLALDEPPVMRKD
jgi:hypothetical protein